MRGTQMARQWQIIRFMENRPSGISVSEIAEKLEAPPRTIYRDLEAIHDAGFPLYTDKDRKNSLWKMLDTYKKGFPVPMTSTELMALHMSRGLLSVFHGTVFHDSIETLFQKVKAAL
jgi:predicted DNA-binding transcriptional regulator YafY